MQQTMGIINLTPDSFSDGGQISTCTDLAKKIKFLKCFGVDIFDFGAQSTAPNSQAVTADEELKRFDLFQASFSSLDLKHFSISIDTYRPAVFAKLYDFLKSKGHMGDIYWNDVSGVLDNETILLLKEKKDIKYILTYTNIPQKEDTVDHTHFIDRHMNTFSVIEKLKEGPLRLSFLPSKNIFLDFGFGFSKTREQNYDLLRNLQKILRVFDQETTWVWGLSRKSLFQKLVEDDQDFFQSELLHILALNGIKHSCHHSIFRVHDPRITQTLAVYSDNIINGCNV